MRRVTIWYSFWFLLLEGILFTLIYLWRINIPCFFETVYKIPCPLCYMTQAVDNLLAGNIQQAILTNPLLIVLFPFGIVMNGICIIDFCTLFKHNYMKVFLEKGIVRWWSVAVLFAGWVYILIYH